MIIERARLDAAKARGRNGGRKPVLDSKQLEMVEAMLEKSRDLRAIARTVNVSERTIRRVAAGTY